MNAGIARNYLGETVPVQLSDGDTVSATVAYRDDADLNRFVVIFPPHPALGGDSQNNVVQALLAEGAARGILAMTFDYRGVAQGKVGTTDLLSYWEALEACGDFTTVIADVVTVVRTVRQEFGAGNCCAAVGYSFGSYLALRCAPTLGAAHVVGVSPPVMAYDFIPWLDDLDVRLFVAPEDVFCPNAQAEAIFSGHHVKIETVPSDDHFFRGMEFALAGQVLDALGFPASTL